MIDIKDLLEAWGNTSSDRTGTEYKSKAVGIEGADPEIEYRPILDDEQYLAVDAAVCELKSFDIDGYNIITLNYRHHISCRAIAKQMCRRPDYVTAYLGRAESFISGVLHVLKFAA